MRHLHGRSMDRCKKGSSFRKKLKRYGLLDFFENNVCIRSGGSQRQWDHMKALWKNDVEKGVKEYQMMDFDSFGNFNWHAFNRFPRRRPYFELIMWETNDLIPDGGIYQIERKVNMVRLRKDIIRRLLEDGYHTLALSEKRTVQRLPWDLSNTDHCKLIGKVFPRARRSKKYSGFVRKRPSLDRPTAGDYMFMMRYLPRKWKRFHVNPYNMFRSSAVVGASQRQIGKSTRAVSKKWIKAEEILSNYLEFESSFPFNFCPMLNDFDFRNFVLSSRTNLEKKGGLSSEAGMGFGRPSKKLSRQAACVLAFEIADKIERGIPFDYPILIDVFGARGKRFFMQSHSGVKQADCRPIWMSEHIMNLFLNVLTQIYNIHFSASPIWNPVRLKKLEMGERITEINYLLGRQSVSCPFDVGACDASWTTELKIAVDGYHLSRCSETNWKKASAIWKMFNHYNIHTPIVTLSRFVMFFTNLNHTGKPFTAIDTTVGVNMVLTTSIKRSLMELDESGGLWHEFLDSNRRSEPVIIIPTFGDDVNVSTTRFDVNGKWALILKEISPRIIHHAWEDFGMKLENPAARVMPTTFAKSFSWKGIIGVGYNLLKTSRDGFGNVCVPINDLINRFCLNEKRKGGYYDMRVMDHFAGLEGIGGSSLDFDFAKEVIEHRYRKTPYLARKEVDKLVNKKVFRGPEAKNLGGDKKEFDCFGIYETHEKRLDGVNMVFNHRYAIRAGCLSMCGSYAEEFDSFNDPDSVIERMVKFIRSEKFRVYKRPLD